MPPQLGSPVTLRPARQPSPTTTLTGRTVRLVHLSATHTEALFHSLDGSEGSNASTWDYLPDGPYPSIETFHDAIVAKNQSTDPLFFAVLDRQDEARVLGYIAFMSIVPEQLRVEIGHVVFSPALQRTTAATETLFLLIQHAIEDLGYRRIEWKTNTLNEQSRRAALRLGFVFEGVFRQHMISKGRNRDTAWFSLLRDDWVGKGIKMALELWLQESNFDEEGMQKKSLQDIRQGL